MFVDLRCRVDLLGGLGSGEWRRSGVVGVDEPPDRGVEVVDAGAGAAADRLAGDDRVQDLDQVQPRCGRRVRGANPGARRLERQRIPQREGRPGPLVTSTGRTRADRGPRGCRPTD